ncbi:GEVED domain-containing protein [Hymenobacter convexus]|uniref:GEVED domain-containing protein n=1 Tax=Hymenobacter sp. CA1UV-4 TaxID=3063782 RepID=UPI0027123894|nr:GEVED domain-containing protein [Hymenobacter sp. CA1UV-4]MDO7853104.1 GEVED domain-containing protein [Hymenobacter sp. CA1UV-4]
MQKPLPFLRRLLSLAVALGAGYAAQAQVIPQPVPLAGSSFNADIVANGTAQTAAGGSAVDIDGGGYFFPSVDYTTSGAAGFFHPSLGLPFGQSFLSVGTPNVRFNLAGYGSSNALRLTGTNSGTLTMASPVNSQTLYVLVTGGGVGTATANNLRLTVNFADGSSQVFARIVPDWYSTIVQPYHTTTAFVLNTRVNGTGTNNTFELPGNNPRLFQLVLPLDQTRATSSAVTSIQVDKIVSTGIIHVLAVSGGGGAYAPVALTLPAAGTPSANSATGQDVVANGTSQSSPNNSATDVDGAGYFLVSADYTKSTTGTPLSVTQGLPLNGSIPSLTVPGLTYQLQPYTGVNALQIRGAASGTLAFATPTSATEVYVLANTVVTSGLPGAGTMVVNFSDGTSHSFSPTFYNWFTTTGVAAPTYVGYSPNARVQGYTSGGASNTTNAITSYISTTTGVASNTPNLFEFKLALSPAEYGKTVTGVTVTGLSNTILSVLAASINPGAPTTCALSSGGLSVAANSATACASTSLNLVLTGVPPQLGYTYQWQYQKGSGTAWANIPTTASTTEPVTTNATSATCTLTNQTAATSYRCVVTCANGTSVTSGELAVGQTDVINCYCNPPQSTTNSSCGVNGTITAVNLNGGSGLAQTGISCPTAPYGSFGIVPTATATGTLTQATAYTLTVNVSNASRVAAWFDANQNGVFEASEYLTAGTTTGAGTVTLSIPAALTAGAAVGTTKLRIRSESNSGSVLTNSANTCAATVYGETLDYTLTVTAGMACAGAPAATTATSTATSVCGGTGFTLDATGITTGVTGLSYQWQSSPAGANNFTNLGSAQAASTYAVSSIAASTDYRLVVTCTASGQSTTSSIISVTRAYLNCYCTVLSTGTNEYIKSVTFPGTSGFTNTTGANSTNGTGDFTGNSTYTTTLNQGATYANGVSLTARVNSNGAQGGMWIDYDHSGTFDAGEYIALGNADLPSRDVILTTTLTVPLTALTGPTRVRVRWRNSSIAATDACTTNTAAGCVNGCVWYGETEDYLITIAAPATCTAPPSSIAATASTANACANSSFTLSTNSIPTTLGGYTFQWQSSPAGAGTFANISGATTQNYTVASQTAATDYQLVVSCQYGGTPVTSNVVSVGQNAFDQCYCTTSSTSGCTNYGSISNVSIGTLNNSSGCAASAYTLYPASTATTNLNAGTSTPLSLTIANAGAGYRYGVWIDFNQNGTFDASEFVASSTTSTTASPTATVVIPATALAGATRMRVRTKAGITSYGDFGAGDACVAQFDGETEDYTVTIVAPTACAGAPAALVASGTASSVCAGSSFTLSASNPGNITGLNYQWQSSPAGTGTFANIGGATALSYTVASQTAATDYRLQVTCTASGQTTSSNVVAVGQNNFANCYCTPTGGDCSNEYIRGVTLNTLSNVGTGTTGTGCTSGGYVNYTANPALTTTLSQGITYALGLNLRINSNPAGAGVWLDFNQNGIFEASEYTSVYSNTTLTGANDVSASANITIPATALTGPTRMRVRSANSTVSISAGSACTNNYFGEVEDYLVTISSSLPDLTVSTAATIPAGTYNNVTVTGTGTGTLTGATAVNGTLAVLPGGTLNTACQPLTGPGTFALAAGATLNICDPAGITLSGATGAIQLATRKFSIAGTYGYNGSAAQVTGSGLPAQVRNLTVNNPAGLTLSQPVALRRLLTLTSGNLLGGQNLTLRSDADSTALVAVGASGGTVTGAATVQRYISPATNAGLGYRHFAAPVTNTTVADLTTASFSPSVSQGAAYNASATPGTVTPFPNVFGYSEAQQATSPATSYSVFDRGWLAPTSTADPLTSGKGYTVNLAAGQMVDFVGTLGTGNVSQALTRGTTPDAGWNLLGNPYPSTLNWDNVTIPAGVDAAVYVYQSTSQYAGSYTSYTNGLGTGTRSATIGMGQGFFVRVSPGTTAATFTLTNAARSTDFGTGGSFQRGNDPRARVRLALENTGATLSDAAYVYFENGATAGIDARYDAVKLANPTGLGLAAVAAGTELAINGLPLTSTATVVPLTVNVPQAGTYTLRADELLNLPAGPVYLRDALTGQQIDLLQQASYRFSTTGTASIAGRFTLNFSPMASPLAAQLGLTAASVSVYPNPAHTSVTVLLPAVPGAKEAQLTLFNSLGQRVREQTVALSAAGAQTVLSVKDLAAGVYTLHLQVAGQGAVTRRVVVE